MGKPAEETETERRDAANRRLRIWIGLSLAAVALVVTACVLFYAVPKLSGSDQEQHEVRPLVAWLLIGWAVGPPTWFLVEWAFLRPSDPDGSAAKEMVRSQELASKIWAGVLAALGVLYAVKIGGV